MLGLLLSATFVQAQPVESMPKWIRFYMPIKPQLVPGGGGFGGGSGGVQLCAMNTAQTPDTYFCGTDPLGNSIIIGEAADSGFDYAFPAATDPTLVIRSHNQSTTQWIGLYNNATNSVAESGTSSLLLRSGAINHLAVDSEGVRVNTTDAIGFSSGNVASTAVDTFLTRETTATIQMGADVNGAAIAQTFKSCDGITGTDVAGCNALHAGGRGTGAGAPGDVDLQTGIDLATGTTPQTLFDRHYYRGKAKALTESSATTFVTFNIPTTLTAVGGEVHYCLHANDATDVQERCGDVDFACVNKAGTVTPATPSILGTEAVAVSVGTLTNAFTMINSGTTCSLQANAVSSLTQTSLNIRYSVEMHGSGTVTP